jgi:hypothetical protein
MGHRTATFTTSAASYSAGVWTIDYGPLPWRPDGTRGSHQISMSGLDGGTFAVEIRLPEDPSWKTHTSGATETDVVLVGSAVVSAFRVTVSSTGGSAAPIVYITSMQRGFAT